MGIAILLILALVLAVIIGSVMGMIAKSRVDALRLRLIELEREVSRLRMLMPRTPTEPTRPATTAAPPPTTTPWTPAPLPRHLAEPPAVRVSDPAPSTPASPAPQPVVPDSVAVPDILIGTPAIATAIPTPEPAADAAGQAATAAPPAKPPATPVATPTPSGGIAGMEAALGLRWMTWVGVGLLFLGIAFFLKYAYDRDWLGHLFGPRLRIATAAAAALGSAIAGWRSLGRGMTALGQGLLGGGQALLYLTIFAAFQPALMVVDAPLIGTTTAFILMALVTAAGLIAAVRLDALAMAFIAVLGGIAAPVLVSSGQDARDALFAYLLLLDLGVLGAALHRRWRALDLLAFAGTVLLFAGWCATWYLRHPQPDLPTLAWLGIFHLVFLLIPFAHHWLHRSPVTVERFALALANLAWTLGYAAWMLHERAPYLLAAGCLLGAALYLALGLATRARIGEDRRTRDGFLALAALLLTLGLFYLLPVDGITTAWFAEASVLLWLGWRFAHPPTRWAAVLVLSVAVARTLGIHLPAGVAASPLVFNRWFATLVVAWIGLAAFAVIQRRHGASGGERVVARIAGIGAGLWILLAGSLEILRHAEGHPAAWSGAGPAMTITWLLLFGVGGFLAWALRNRDLGALVAGLLPLAGSAVAAALAYDRYPADAIVLLNGCCVGGLAMCAVILLTGAMARRLAAEWLAAGLFGACQLALVALASVEALAWLQRGGPAGAATTGLLLGWVWVLAAIAGSLAALAWRSRRCLVLAGLPLAAGLLTALWLYLAEATGPYRLLVNQRALLALLGCAGLAWMGTVGRRIADPPRPPDRGATPGLALALALLAAACEAVRWSWDNLDGMACVRWAMWLLGLAAVLGACGGRWRHRATGNRGLRSVALAAMWAGLALALLVFLVGWRAELMFLNLRLGLLAAGVAAALLWSTDPGLRRLRWVALAAAMLGLSAEPPAWLLLNIHDPAEAARSALFSVTVMWVAMACILLTAGFARDRRPLRLLALAIFGLTAAKLLLLDMSGAQQLYRILAFVLVGLVFVGASWLYHRVERRLVRRA